MPPKVVKKSRTKARKRPWVETTLEIREDGLAVEDYISRLPDDCLLRVFGHLTRQELHKTKLLNERLSGVAYNRSRGKSRPGCLSFGQELEGYRFMLSTHDKEDNRRDSVKTFEYVFKHSKWNRQGFREKRRLIRADKIRDSESLHDLPIASHFNNVLGALLIQYPVKKVVLSRIRLDAEFLSVISSSLKGSELQELRIDRVTLDNTVIDAFEGLQTLTRTSKLSNITITDTPTLLGTGFFDEKWLTNTNSGGTPSLQSVESWEDYYKHRFYPSKAILPVITAYDTLRMPSLTLNADWIGEFIMMHLNNGKMHSEKYVHWRIGVDRGIIREEIQAQFNIATEFQCALRNGMFTVMKKNGSLKAQFEIIPIVIDDGSTIFLLDICFSTPEVFERDALPHYRFIALRRSRKFFDEFDTSDGKCWTELPAPNSETYWRYSC